ncbi:hypothetical protein Pla52n_17250 [Stieleria varia]|uniref:Uncharacterized protein n=1 Tax=Stieleria varia TaxID=2528005 RepID=A0A5C6B272_9BACT|nr:hypothetical protein Pla52n_17250 [Stieleria varia]
MSFAFGCWWGRFVTCQTDSGRLQTCPTLDTGALGRGIRRDFFRQGFLAKATTPFLNGSGSCASRVRAFRDVLRLIVFFEKLFKERINDRIGLRIG